ncbi:MAG: ATPase, T2SS/T4P/T4SS family [Pirellulales bacterium]
MSVNGVMAKHEHATFVEDLSGGAEAGVSALLDRGTEVGASDLFLAMNENDAVVSMRHMGTVRTIGTLTAADGKRWIAHVKALAGIPLENKFKPKEGRWLRVHADGRKTDLRVNSIPTLFGEDLAIRLLERDGNLQQLEQLGLMHHELQTLRSMLESPGGLILVTGPTSSGKTTTLYACLHHLNNGERKINTIEDPIEYAVEGIRQTQINLHWDCDFPEMLRSVLRQAPDVIMIGEIRDPITAQTAVRAANSGHLVLATLHSATACGAIQSMLNLGVHPHFFSNSLRGVVAQRLTRILCDQCRVDFDLSESPLTFEEIGHLLHEGEGRKLYTSVGCESCRAKATGREPACSRC